MPNLPTTAQTGFNALSSQQQTAHRAKIGVKVRSILGQFWRETGVPDLEQAMELEGWMDVLENCSHSEIRAAWNQYVVNPNNRSAKGRLMKPDAGALLMIVYARRPKPQIVKQPVPVRTEPRCSPEAHAKIMAESGFQIRPMPKPQNAEQTRSNINAAKTAMEERVAGE